MKIKYTICYALMILGMITIAYPDLLDSYSFSILKDQRTEQKINTFLWGNALSFIGLFLLLRLPANRKHLYTLVIINCSLCVFMQPYTSDDMYRYLWDGQVTIKGESPYQYKPQDIFDQAQYQDLQQLYPYLNSNKYYSVYPPLSQIFFTTSAWLSMGNIMIQFVCLKILVGLCFIITIVFLDKTVHHLKLPLKNTYIFALNPFVLTELVGQAHSEIFMVAALSIALYYYHTNHIGKCVFYLSLATAAKLYPLLFIAFVVLQKRYYKHLWIPPVTGLLLFLPYYTPDAIFNILTSLRLYGNDFEYNAPTLFWIRDYAYSIKIFNQYGRFNISFWLLFLIIYLYNLNKYLLLKSEYFIDALFFTMFFYLALNPTVHPWYIVPLVLLAVFNKNCHNLAMHWSWLIIPTYLFYGVWQGYWLKFRWITIEWLCVFALVIPFLLQYIVKLRALKKLTQCQKFIIGESLLDNGCGEGYFAEIAQQQLGISCHNLDVLPLNRCSSVPHTIYDGEKIPLESNSFATSTCILMLHHCSNPEKILEETIRITNKRLIVFESTFENNFDLWLLTILDRMANFVRSFGQMGKEELHFKSVQQWEELFAKNNLQVVKKFWTSRFIHKCVVYVLDIKQSK